MIRLKELRTEKNVTQQEIADKIGVSRQVYANWENEINQPDLKMLSSLADIYGVSADYLLGRTDDFGNAVASLPALSEDENGLLALYRGMTRAQKARFLTAKGYSEPILPPNLNRKRKSKKRLHFLLNRVIILKNKFNQENHK